MAQPDPPRIPGLDVALDPDVPPGTIEFRDADGNVVQRIVNIDTDSQAAGRPVDLGELLEPVAYEPKVDHSFRRLPDVTAIRDAAGFGPARPLQHVPADFDPKAEYSRGGIVWPSAVDVQAVSPDFFSVFAAFSDQVVLSFRAFGVAAAQAAHDMHQLIAAAFGIEHRSARCWHCNPRANPPRLSIDGHAYHRRARARKRRR